MENIIDKKSNLKVLGDTSPAFNEMLTDDALLFIQEIEEKFGPRRKELLKKRIDIQSRIDDGHFPDFYT